LAANCRGIERTVILTDGRSSTTPIALDQSPGKKMLSGAELAELADAQFLRLREWPSVDLASAAVRLVDLFSGCGLMTLGVWEACRAIGRRVEPVLALDISETAVRVYKQNFPGARVMTTEIEHLLERRLGEKSTKIERKFTQALGSIDILVGGPPCQGHSNLNNYTRRSDPKNALYERMARFAELVRPNHIIIENVSAVLHDRGRVVTRTAIALRRLGYSVDQIVADVSSLGVAQRRRRHVLVASLTRTIDLERTLALYERRPRNLKWAIGDLSTVTGKTPFDVASASSEANRKRIQYLFMKNCHDLPDSRRPDCHRLKAHTYKSVYGRMHWDEPAQTITSGFTSMGQGRYVHPQERRTLTPHEAARLQFIPDFFRFGNGVGRAAVAEMIGNAVPTKLTYVLALDLLR
jgi:DNA (cytosine-5)-methyltransferase 1